jgi:MYXO-CTERM domain-containing protein
MIECPQGWDWTPDGCVPVCKAGYKPQQEGDQWTCVPDDSGCGCGANATGAGLWLLFGLALFFRRRK